MKKVILFLVLSLTLSVVIGLAGCGGTPTAPTIEEDFINIISVSPNSGLIDGLDTDFTVVVEYNLYSSNQGSLEIGFNVDDIDGQMDGWSMVQNAEFLVNKGSGTHEFNVTVKPRNWGGQGDFSVLVILDEVPWDSNYVLASDEKILTFQ